MALNDAFMFPVQDLTFEKVVRDRNSRTSQALRELIGVAGGGGTGGASATVETLGNAGEAGRSLMRAATAAAARAAIGAGTSSLGLGTGPTTAKRGDWTPAAADISDATDLGKSVIQAVSAAALRATIGAGTSNLALGTSSTTAKAGDWKPASADISDASDIGKSVLKAASGDAIRSLIGAGTGSGGSGGGTSVVVDPTDSDYATVSGSGVTVDPSDSDYLIIS